MDKTEIGVVPNPTPDAGPRGPIVMVVEDNPAQGEYIGALLKSVGYEVNIATDGAMALARLTLVRPALILLDLMMPQFDGRGFLQRFKRLPAFRDIPVIVITSSQSIQVITEVCAAGAKDFISKPIDPKALLEKAGKYAPIRSRG